jgi:hypothetical protein
MMEFRYVISPLLPLNELAYHDISDVLNHNYKPNEILFVLRGKRGISIRNPAKLKKTNGLQAALDQAHDTLLGGEDGVERP